MMGGGRRRGRGRRGRGGWCRVIIWWLVRGAGCVGELWDREGRGVSQEVRSVWGRRMGELVR